MKDEEKAMEILEKVSFNKYVGESYFPSDDSVHCEVTCGFIKRMIVQSAMEMAQWKDEQFKKLLIDKNKLLSPSSAQDSVKRCTLEEIYEELFGEETPNIEIMEL